MTKTLKQHKCALTDEWMKNMCVCVCVCVCVCIHTRSMEYYSAIKKNEKIPLAVTWLDRGLSY